jgi:hypothetical protein
MLLGATSSSGSSVLGGVGVFLLGMTIMTGSLKALAGSSLRTLLSTAATTPIGGAIWGTVIASESWPIGTGHQGLASPKTAR